MRTPRELTISTVLLGVGLTLCAAPPASAQGNQEGERGRRLEHGRRLAARHCSECHLEPHPDILPRQSWQTALGYMGLLMGMRDLDWLAGKPEVGRAPVAARE